MRRLLAALLFALALPAASLAQERFPEKPVRFIVPFPPGGGTDVLARILGAKLGDLWGHRTGVGAARALQRDRVVWGGGPGGHAARHRPAPGA